MIYQFLIVVSFLMFLMQLGVMISNYREMVNFENVLTTDIENQLEVSRSMQESMKMTQALVIASVKNDQVIESERVRQFEDISSKLDRNLLHLEQTRWPFEDIVIRKPIPMRP